MGSPFQREYGIAPELKRCGWYIIVGAVLCGFTAAWVNKFAPNGPQRNMTAFVVVVGLGVFVTLILMGWRLRVDGDGVSHGLLLGWDLWTRDDLASGRIRKLKSHTLCDPNRWFGARYLSLDFLANEDRREVLEEINKHYRLPPPPPVPDKLELRYGFRRSATFAKESVQLTHGKAIRDFAWSDIQDIHVCRLDPVRRDFVKLLIVLPAGEEIELKFNSNNGQQIPTWKGPDAEVVSEFFSQSPARERVYVSMAAEAASRPRDAERDLAETKKGQRFLCIVTGFFGLFIVAWYVWQVIAMGLIPATLFMAIMVAMSIPILYPYYFLYRMNQKQLAAISEHLAELKGEPRPPT
jgi:hypothetical protein